MLLSHCTLCGHRCGTDRTAGELGICGVGDSLVIASACLHHGEETPLSGTRGSGTIFFSNCNLHCKYCQNHQISHAGKGKASSLNDLVGMMLNLQEQRAHNINFVSPTPYVPMIRDGIKLAKIKGLKLPIVYNTGGYDNLETIIALEGLVDIYLPDMKYSDSALGASLSGCSDYPIINQVAVGEMYRQVGGLILDENGIAQSGLIIRHLVLPGHIQNSLDLMYWIGKYIGKTVWLSVMSQYHPTGRYRLRDGLERTLSSAEYQQVVSYLEDNTFQNYWLQELQSVNVYNPDFDQTNPFFPQYQSSDYGKS